MAKDDPPSNEISARPSMLGDDDMNPDTTDEGISGDLSTFAEKFPTTPRAQRSEMMPKTNQILKESPSAQSSQNEIKQ